MVVFLFFVGKFNFKTVLHIQLVRETGYFFYIRAKLEHLGSNSLITS